MYDKLLNSETFTIGEILSMFNISERTFRRYINEINCFLADNYKNQQIVYRADKKEYYLENF